MTARTAAKRTAPTEAPAPVTPLAVPRQSPAQRVKALQAEAKAAAAEEVAGFLATMEKAREQAAEIAGFGDAVAIGIRERASRVATQLEADIQHVASIVSKGR